MYLVTFYTYIIFNWDGNHLCSSCGNLKSLTFNDLHVQWNDIYSNANAARNSFTSYFSFKL